MKPLPLIDVIAGFPAHSALFTTFTLTLTWFEAYLLRPLERAGVQNIGILADPLGVASAVTEGLAAGPGLRYSLEAIRLDDRAGVFHPKIALLWNDTEALIAVGSGNLTFAGMMRNLEQWDVLATNATVAPAMRCSSEVAVGIARFLENLQVFVGEGARASDLLVGAVSALRRFGATLPSSTDLFWLDSSERAIAPQMAARIPSRKGRTLQVLSPFHADGSATRRLAQALEAGSVDLLYTAGVTSFPLDAPRGPAWPQMSTRALSLEPEEAGRSLHAKVMRLQDDEVEWILAGSANATSRGLWGIDNIEACLLRRAPLGTWDDLLDSEPGEPDYVAADEKDGSASPLGILWARASGSRVEAEVSWGGDGPPPDLLRVRMIRDRAVWHGAAWPADGTVFIPFPAGFDLVRPSAMRLEVVAGSDAQSHRAVGWIAFDALLDAPPAWRSAVRAWQAMLDGAESGNLSSDDRTLLHLFARKRAEVVSILARGRKTKTSRSSDGSNEPEEVPVPLLLLRSLARGGSGRGSAGGLDGAGGIDLVARATEQLNHAFGVRRGGGAKEDGTRKRRRKKPRRLDKKSRQAIEDFQETFLARTMEIDGPQAEHPEEAVVYSAFCARLALSFWLRDGDRRGFWLAASAILRALLSPRPQIERGPLLPQLSAGPPAVALVADALVLWIALLAWRLGGGVLTGIDTIDPRHLLRGASLRRALATLDAAAESPPQIRAVPFELLEAMPEEAPDLVGLLTELRETQVPGDNVEVLMRLVTDPVERARADLAELTADERAALAAADGSKQPMATTPWSTTCPGCNRSLPTMASSRLERWTVAQCNCGRWLLPLDPK